MIQWRTERETFVIHLITYSLNYLIIYNKPSRDHITLLEEISLEGYRYMLTVLQCIFESRYTVIYCTIILSTYSAQNKTVLHLWRLSRLVARVSCRQTWIWWRWCGTTSGCGAPSPSTWPPQSSRLPPAVCPDPGTHDPVPGTKQNWITDWSKIKWIWILLCIWFINRCTRATMETIC